MLHVIQAKLAHENPVTQLLNSDTKQRVSMRLALRTLLVPNSFDFSHFDTAFSRLFSPFEASATYVATQRSIDD